MVEHIDEVSAELQLAISGEIDSLHQAHVETCVTWPAECIPSQRAASRHGVSQDRNRPRGIGYMRRCNNAGSVEGNRESPEVSCRRILQENAARIVIRPAGRRSDRAKANEVADGIHASSDRERHARLQFGESAHLPSSKDVIQHG